MEVQSKLSYMKISPYKARLVIDQIRYLNVAKALNILSFSNKKISVAIKSILMSAVANAEHNNGLDVDTLYISSAFVNKGPIIKRFRARAKGRGNQIIKRTSHIVIKVSEKI